MYVNLIILIVMIKLIKRKNLIRMIYLYLKRFIIFNLYISKKNN